MVAPSVAGRGVGRALANRVLELAAEDGYLAMQFNAVVETNTNAIRLWESLGFTILATVPEAFRHPERGLVGLHIMHRRL
jgi:ribosomal protein S18 acetylase RimI-like enzyme